MYHVNPYVRSLYSRQRRHTHGVEDYHTNYFSSILTAEQQKQVADILDKLRDPTTPNVQPAWWVYINSPAYAVQPPEVRLVIAAENLALSGGDYSEFIKLVNTNTDENVVAYMKTPEFAQQTDAFKLAVAQYTQWKASLAQGGQSNQPPQQPPIEQPPQQPPIEQPPVDPHQQQPVDPHQQQTADQHPQQSQQPNDSSQRLRDAYNRMSTETPKVEKPKTPWLLYLLLAYIAYKVSEKK